MDAELFYVLDLGDMLTTPLSKVLQPTLANAVGHVLSFAINGALWVAFATIAVRVVF